MNINIRGMFSTALLSAWILLTLATAQICHAQSKDNNTVAALAPAAVSASGNERPANVSSAKAEPAAAAPEPEISPAVARELATMRAEIEALKAELKRSGEAPANAMRLHDWHARKPEIVR